MTEQEKLNAARDAVGVRALGDVDCPKFRKAHGWGEAAEPKVGVEGIYSCAYCGGNGKRPHPLRVAFEAAEYEACDHGQFEDGLGYFDEGVCRYCGVHETNDLTPDGVRFIPVVMGNQRSLDEWAGRMERVVWAVEEAFSTNKRRMVTLELARLQRDALHFYESLSKLVKSLRAQEDLKTGIDQLARGEGRPWSEVKEEVKSKKRGDYEQRNATGGHRHAGGGAGDEA